MKLGLVFAGGGGKGAYEIGVWKALQEFGIDKKIECISGTSVGALNSALFIQADYDRAEKVWLNLSNDKILQVNIGQILKCIITLLLKAGLAVKFKAIASAWLNQLKNYGVFSKEGLITIIDECIDLDKISKSNIRVYATCTQNSLPFKTEYILINERPIEQIKSIILASSAIPGVYDSEEVDNCNYMDGGLPLIGDNVPIQPLVDEQCDKIIVVHLSRDYLIDKSKYPDTKIFEIIPNKPPGGFISGTLNFSYNNIKKLISYGYNDSYKILKQAFEISDNFHKFDESFIRLVEDEKHSMIEIRALMEKTSDLKEENSRLLREI